MNISYVHYIYHPFYVNKVTHSFQGFSIVLLNRIFYGVMSLTMMFVLTATIL